MTAPRRPLLSPIMMPPVRSLGGAAHRSWWRHISRWIVALIIAVIALACAVWAFGAIWYDAPLGAGNKIAAGLAAIVFLCVFVFVRPWLLKLGTFGVAFAGILIWWLRLSPTNDADWQPDVAEKAWADVQGDEVTVHNVRNCDYRTESDYTPQWETRTVRLSQIAGLDLAITYWGSPLIAHPIVSFRFSDAPPLCFSIEVRKTIGQSYSAVRGFYRQFTLIYLLADERDVIRLRTNYRPGEDVYLYRTMATPDQARARFLEYLKTLNSLREKPRWYNAITTNCTTSIRAQRPPSQRTPWDWRILANGKGDEMLYERHAIATGGLPFAELKERSHINEKAHAADQDPEFSKIIREGLPGFDQK